jgi:DNA-binding transcriptional MerR regulator
MPGIDAMGGEAAAGREYTISDLAAACEVTPRAIRFYEDRKLLAPRRVGQIRIFSHRDRVRLELILRGKRLGFSLAEIREMLDLYDADEGHVQQLRAALAKGRRRIAELERQQEDIARTLDELRALERCAIDRLAAQGGEAAAGGTDDAARESRRKMPRPKPGPAVPAGSRAQAREGDRR